MPNVFLCHYFSLTVELEKLPEEDETQAIHYRISKAINDLLQDKVPLQDFFPNS